MLFTTGGLVNLFLSVPMGMVADRVGKKAMMTGGLVASTGALAGIAFAANFGWLILFIALFSPAALGLLSDSVPPHRQSTAMGLYGGICENIGIMGGALLGGIIWEAWGPHQTFISGALACGLAAIVCLALVKNVPPKAAA